MGDVRVVNHDLIRAVWTGEMDWRTGWEILKIVKLAMRCMSMETERMEESDLEECCRAIVEMEPQGGNARVQKQESLEHR